MRDLKKDPLTVDDLRQILSRILAKSRASQRSYRRVHVKHFLRYKGY